MPVPDFKRPETADLAGLPMALDVIQAMRETLSDPEAIAAAVRAHRDELDRQALPVGSGLDARTPGRAIEWVQLPSTLWGPAGPRTIWRVIYTVYGVIDGTASELTPICSMRWKPLSDDRELPGAFVDAYRAGHFPLPRWMEMEP
jgi:hypothetical protein